MKTDANKVEPPSHRLTFSPSQLLRWLGLIGILSVAVMRCVTVFAPVALFDTDPATDLVPLGGFAQAGSLWLDAAMFLSCGIAMLGEWLDRRRLSVLACVFALLPLPIVCWHGAHDALDLWRGSTWAAAAIACVTIAHLARDPRMRIIVAAVLLAVMAPLIVRGVGQISWEHADTVRVYEETKDEFLQRRGWSPDSSAAKIYERRLRQPQPTGWFTTTNIFGSVMMFGMIASLGLMIGAIRARMESGWAAAMGLCCIAAAAMLVFTGSKGAMLAATIGVMLALIPLVVHDIACAFASRLGGLLIIALVLFTLIAVMVRGSLLPESFAGDKSLLFRWHYTVTSARIIADHPLAGVGPDGFQDAYTLHRVPRNPEEVQSAHSMFWDWPATLGIPAGAAWTALVFTMLFRTGLPLRIKSPEHQATAPIANRTITLSVLAVVAIGLLPAFLVESGTLDPRSMLLRVVGGGVFVAVAILAARLLARTDERITRWCFATAAIAVVIHGQIEMTFHQPGSVVWAMCALGLAGAIPADERVSARRSPATLVWALLLVIAGGMMIAFAESATNRETAMAEAADMIRPLPEGLEKQIPARQRAAERLLLAYQESRPRDLLLLEAAARQAALAADVATGPQQVKLLQSALSSAEMAIRNHRAPSATGLAILYQTRLASITNQQADWAKAIEFAQRMTELDPHGLSAWRQYGDVLWAAGERHRAAKAYQRALECDRNFALDEPKQLDEKQRVTLQSRINEALNGAATRP